MDDVVKWCLDSHDGPSAVARVTILEDVAWTIFVTSSDRRDFSGMQRETLHSVLHGAAFMHSHELYITYIACLGPTTLE